MGGCKFSRASSSRLFSRFILSERSHLSKEIMVSYALLRNGGHLYIDDLDEDWPQIKKVYEYISESEMFSTSKIGCRTGLLIKQECPTLHSAPVSRTLGI